MKNTEKRIMHLNPEIIEAFENDEEMLLIKGGTLKDWLEALTGGVNIYCPNKNCGSSCTNDGC